MLKPLRILSAVVSTASLLVVIGCGGQEEPQMDAQQSMTEQAEEAPSYPLDWCVVSGEKLGSMGDPYPYEYQGRTVYFCCANCVESFNAAPARYMARLDSAASGMIQFPGDAGSHEGHDHDGHDHEGHDHDH